MSLIKHSLNEHEFSSSQSKLKMATSLFPGLDTQTSIYTNQMPPCERLTTFSNPMTSYSPQVSNNNIPMPYNRTVPMPYNRTVPMPMHRAVPIPVPRIGRAPMQLPRTTQPEIQAEPVPEPTYYFHSTEPIYTNTIRNESLYENANRTLLEVEQPIYTSFDPLPPPLPARTTGWVPPPRPPKNQNLYSSIYSAAAPPMYMNDTQNQFATVPVSSAPTPTPETQPIHGQNAINYGVAAFPTSPAPSVYSANRNQASTPLRTAPVIPPPNRSGSVRRSSRRPLVLLPQLPGGVQDPFQYTTAVHSDPHHYNSSPTVVQHHPRYNTALPPIPLPQPDPTHPYGVPPSPSNAQAQVNRTFEAMKQAQDSVDCQPQDEHVYCEIPEIPVPKRSSSLPVRPAPMAPTQHLGRRNSTRPPPTTAVAPPMISEAPVTMVRPRPQGSSRSSSPRRDRRNSVGSGTDKPSGGSFYKLTTALMRGLSFTSGRKASDKHDSKYGPSVFHDAPLATHSNLSRTSSARPPNNRRPSTKERRQSYQPVSLYEREDPNETAELMRELGELMEIEQRKKAQQEVNSNLLRKLYSTVPEKKDRFVTDVILKRRLDSVLPDGMNIIAPALRYYNVFSQLLDANNPVTYDPNFVRLIIQSGLFNTVYILGMMYRKLKKANLIDTNFIPVETELRVFDCWGAAKEWMNKCHQINDAYPGYSLHEPAIPSSECNLFLIKHILWGWGSKPL